MSDHLLIYFIVILNCMAQILLIRRLKLSNRDKYLFYGYAAGIPLLLAVTMRLLIAGSLFHAHVVDQSPLEHVITTITGSLLIIGPWMVTLSALLMRWKARSTANIITQ